MRTTGLFRYNNYGKSETLNELQEFMRNSQFIVI